MVWSPEFLVYPFLFIAIYFESFLLVTFLSKPARDQRSRPTAIKTPNVAIIVPCWNESSTIKGTTDSLLKLEYPKDKLSIVLVNDGSTDTTPQVMEKFANNPQVKIIHKENGGKHTALNAGIDASPNAELIGCLDADSFVEPDALREIISCFDKPNVMAATASMSVHKPKTIIQRMQYTEYILGITLRHILSSVNGLYVTPGPFSIYRANIFKTLGGFVHAHQTEDMEMALRTQRAGYVIENAIRARVYTKAPATFFKLLEQRTRWSSGFLRNMIYEYRTLIANPRYGTLGMLVLPIALFSLVGSIFMFITSIVVFSQNILNSVFMTSGVPLSYVVASQQLSWFYLPTNGIVIFGIILISVTTFFIFAGKHLSKTPGGLTANLIIFTLLYGLISPLWAIRSVADVARGTRRAWRIIN